MKRRLYRERTIDMSPEAVDAQLRRGGRELLQTRIDNSAARPAGDGSFLVRLPTRVLGARTAKAMRMATGVAVTRGGRTVLPVVWHAEPLRAAFPAFAGTIEVEPIDQATSKLAVVGTYRVPGGILGLTADRTVLRGVAEQAADALLDEFAHALSQPAIQPTPRALTDNPLRVADVMTHDPLVLTDDQPLRTAALLLVHYDIDGAPVVDPGGALIGVLSEADILEKEARPRFGLGRRVTDAWRRRQALTVGQACSRPAHCTAPDAALHDAARELLDRDIARLVVIDHSRIAGIVTRHDILRALLRSDAEIDHAVATAIDAFEEPDILATIEWGVVTLTGTISRRSRIPGLAARVEAVDGVMHVDAGDLRWRDDDVTPTALPVA